MIVKAARLHGHEIERLLALSVVQHADGIDLRAISVFGVRIRCHVVSPRILVHEQHARPDRNGEFLRAHTARGQREGVGIGWRGRRTRGAVAPATARGEEQAQQQDEDCHCRRLSKPTAAMAIRFSSPAGAPEDDLLNGDPALPTAVIRSVVIVVPAGPGVGKTERGLRLIWLQQSYVRDRRARRVRRMRIGLHVGGSRTVVDERDALTDRDSDLGRTDRAVCADRDRRANRANRSGRPHHH